jgi:hypothetical protein
VLAIHLRFDETLKKFISGAIIATLRRQNRRPHTNQCQKLMPTLPVSPLSRAVNLSFLSRLGVGVSGALLCLSVTTVCYAADVNTQPAKATAKAAVKTPAKAVAASKKLSPTADQAKASRLVARQLSVLHYNKTPLNDALSADIWTAILSNLKHNACA